MIFPRAVSSLNVYKLIRYDNQLKVVYQYFTNMAALQKMGYYNKVDRTKSVGYIIDMPKYHNAGIWRMD